MKIFEKKLIVPAIFYIVASLLYVVVIQQYASHAAFPYTLLNPVFKVIPDLIAFFVCITLIGGTVRFWMAGACGACALGDTMLGISREGILFKLALIFYLTGHIFFIVSFLKYAKFSISKIVFNVIVVIYTAGIGIAVVPNCPAIADKISIILYIIIITAMALVASHVNLKKSNIVFIGACLFVLSDSMIAVNKFVFTEKPVVANPSSGIEIQQRNSSDVKIVLAVINPLPSEKTFAIVTIPLLSVILTIYYSAMFFIAFGFVYVINLGKKEY